jgi:hypothetical protein
MNTQDSDWMRMVQRLETAFGLEGVAALAKMSAIEAYVLYEENAVALEAAEKMLTEKPGHERWTLRRDHLKAEVSDIAAWLKENVSLFNEPPPAPGTHRQERGLPAGSGLAPMADGDRKAAAARIRQAIAGSQRPKEPARQPNHPIER